LASGKIISVLFLFLAFPALLLAVGAIPPAVPCNGCAFSSPVPAQTLGYPTTDGNIYWEGGFETGDLSQWWPVGYGSGPTYGTATVETNLVRWGKYAVQFSVRPPGDNSTPNRQEIAASAAQTGSTVESKDYYYSWSTYIPSVPNLVNGWPSAGWTNVGQWLS